MHQEHGNEMNKLAQVIEQSPTHKQSYLCVAPCSHVPTDSSHGTEF